MSDRDCIPDEMLHALAAGTLSDEQAAPWEAHLLECTPCLLRTQSINKVDTIVATLQRGQTHDLSVEEASIVEGLIDRIANREELSAAATPTSASMAAETPTAAHATLPSLLPSEGAITPDTLVGPYRIVKKLGEGGMGAVYLATHTKLQKSVALKILPEKLTSQPGAVARFEREMRAVGKLNHPHIVQAHDAGEVDGHHYLAMEYVEGSDLHVLVKQRGPMTVVNACKAVRQTAQALSAAHTAGLVHRDLKPSNLLVDKKGQVKLLDLGLALLADETAEVTELTTAGQTFGTPDYMAPEQWEDSHSADARTDLYALGCTLYFLLVGRPPFGTDKYRTAVGKMKGHVNDAIPSLKAARADAPDEVVVIYQRLMAKAPADRFQTGAELADALAPFVSSRPKPEPPPTVSMPTSNGSSGADVTVATDAGSGRPPAKRRWSITAAGGMILLLGVIVITILNKDGTKTVVRVPPGTEVDVDAAPGSKVSISQTDTATPAPSAGINPAPAKATFSVAQPNNFALEFDGVDDHVEVPTLRLDGLTEFTLEARVRPSLKAGQKGSILAGLSDPLFALDVNEAGRLSGYLMRGRQPAGVFGPHIVDGAWHHVAATVSGGKVELYLDGQRQPVETPPYDVVPESVKVPRDRFLIGAGQAWDVVHLIYPFQGEIDELRISRTIRYLGDSAPPHHLAPDKETLALYHFDEGSGSTLKDASGNNHHGQIVGAKWVRTESKPSGWHSWPTDAPKPAIAPFDAAQAKKHQEEWGAYLKVPVEYTNSLGMKFRLIPPGEFTMGSTPEEIAADLRDLPGEQRWRDCLQSEAPQHKVLLTQPVYLGVREVTQSEYEQVMGVNPSHFALTGKGKQSVAGTKTTDHPVESVSWKEAAEFCAQLSQREKLQPFYLRTSERIRPQVGTGYRLPSEAEWEFACRAGTATKYGTGDDDDHLLKAGWTKVNSQNRTHAVGQLAANPFGLFDIHGNVWEWVNDGWDANFYAKFSEQPAIDPVHPFSASPMRVFRGGSWYGYATECRSSHRDAYHPGFQYYSVGFRVALPVEAVRQAIHISTSKNTSPAKSEADVAAERNFAIRLSPGVHVEIPSLTFDPAKPYTIEAWVTPLDASHTDKHVAGWTGPLSLYVSSAELNWSFGLTRDGAPFQFLLSPTPAVIDHRIHLAAVRTGREFRLFVDGQRVGNSQEHSAPLINQAEPFSLSSHSHPFSGEYDEVRVSRVARYDKNFTPKIRLEPDTDTLALYHCDENGGEQLVDTSSNKHHGKIIGKATWMGIGKAAANGNAPQPAIAPFDAAAAKTHQEMWAQHLGVPVEYTNSIGMKFRLVPPGEFLMGSTPKEIEAALVGVEDAHWQACIQSSAPQHKVILTQPIYWGVKEVTQAEYETVIGTNPSRYAATGTGSAAVAGMLTNNHPVDSVNWNDAVAFCNQMSQQEQLKPCYDRSGPAITLLEGTGYRLPTEAEWEFACRAGTTSKYWVGDTKEALSSVSWLAGNSVSHTHPVGQFEANPFGLYDIHGNVWEWVQDGWGAVWYSQFQENAAINPQRSFVGTSHRVVRGGAWGSAAFHCASAIRDAYDPAMGDGLFGVRVVLSVDAVKMRLTTEKTTSGAAPDRVSAPQ